MFSSLLNKFWSDIPSSFGYTIGDKVPLPDPCPFPDLADQVFTRYEGKGNKDGQTVTIFVFDKKNPALQHRLEDARRLWQRMVSLRHPHILKVLGSCDVASGLYLATEECRPLCLVSSLPKDLSWVANQLTSALAFLHGDAGLVHGTLSPFSSVYVTQCGDWRLAGFCHARPSKNALLSEIVQDLNHDTQCTSVKNYLPSNVPPSLHAAVADRFGLAAVLHWAVRARKAGASGYPTTLTLPSARDVKDYPSKNLKDFIKCLVAGTTGARSFQDMLKHPLFEESLLVSIVRFLENAAVKGAWERHMFLEELPGRLQTVEDQLEAPQLLPLLTRYMETVPQHRSEVVPSVFLLAKKITDPEMYRSLILLPLIPLMTSNDRATRYAVLQYAEEFTPLIDEALASELINPILEGFQDTTPLVREVTLRTMPGFLAKLKGSKLDRTLKAILSLLQTDSEPSLRTNAVVAVAKVVHVLPKDRIRSYFLPCCLTGMVDNTPQTRGASLQAVAYAAALFRPEDATGKLLPALAQRLADGDTNNRVMAFDALERVVNFLRPVLLGSVDAAEDPPAAVDGFAEVPASGWTRWVMNKASATATAAYKPFSRSGTAAGVPADAGRSDLGGIPEGRQDVSQPVCPPPTQPVSAPIDPGVHHPEEVGAWDDDLDLLTSAFSGGTQQQDHTLISASGSSTTDRDQRVHRPLQLGRGSPLLSAKPAACVPAGSEVDALMTPDFPGVIKVPMFSAAKAMGLSGKATEITGSKLSDAADDLFKEFDL